MQDIVKLAHDIAQEAHRGQKRRNGGDYFTEHCVKVAQYVDENYFELMPSDIWGKKDLRYCVLAAAYLHDVLEDTNITSDELLSKGIPSLVVDIVRVLTRYENEPYFDFIIRIKEAYAISPATKCIKIADLTCNMEDATEEDKMGSQYAKYELARYILFNK